MQIGKKSKKAKTGFISYFCLFPAGASFLIPQFLNSSIPFNLFEHFLVFCRNVINGEAFPPGLRFEFLVLSFELVRKSSERCSTKPGAQNQKLKTQDWENCYLWRLIFGENEWNRLR